MVDGAGLHLAISLPFNCFVLDPSVRNSKQSCGLATLDLLVEIGSEVRSKAAKERAEEVYVKGVPMGLSSGTFLSTTLLLIHLPTRHSPAISSFLIPFPLFILLPLMW